MKRIKVGDKLVCKKRSEFFIFGKKYEVLQVKGIFNKRYIIRDEDCVFIFTSRKGKWNYLWDWFEGDLSEIRRNKLKKISGL